MSGGGLEGRPQVARAGMPVDDLPGQLRNLNNEVRELKARLGRLRPEQGELVQLFLPGYQAAIESPVAITRTSGRIARIFVHWDTAGSTPTTIRLKRDGATLQDFTVPAGQDSFEENVTVASNFTTKFLTQFSVLPSDPGIGWQDLSVALSILDPTAR